MNDFKTNEIYEFIYVEKRYDELMSKIENACKTFCERNLTGEYSGWNFNSRKTLIEITYIYVENAEQMYGHEQVSFDEIVKIINEDNIQIK